ncbi:hypothetical protein NSMS1_26380 [Nostoc sp. MS1]|nr:hypothetical protein NSMS1_26380 [Nostoc sp. MS1]
MITAVFLIGEWGDEGDEEVGGDGGDKEGKGENTLSTVNCQLPTSSLDVPVLLSNYYPFD